MKQRRGKEEVTRGKEEVTRSKEEVTRGQEEVTRGKEEVTRSKEEVTRSKEEVTRDKEEVTRSKEEITSSKTKVTEKIAFGLVLLFSIAFGISQRMIEKGFIGFVQIKVFWLTPKAIEGEFLHKTIIKSTA